MNISKFMKRMLCFMLIAAVPMGPALAVMSAPGGVEQHPISVEFLSEMLELESQPIVSGSEAETVLETTPVAEPISPLGQESVASVAGAIPPHVPVQTGDVRIENDSLRIDVGRLGQITRLNIVDMDLSRPQAQDHRREMNFVASDHTFAASFRDSAHHQWLGELILSVRWAGTREGLANAGPFVEVDTNRTMQAGGRATHSNPGGDPNVNPFFQRTHHVEENRVHVQINPDPDNLPTGTEANPAGGNLNTTANGQLMRERIITNFQIDSTFDANTDNDSIRWYITLTNPSDDEYIEFGDVGIPMLWNSRFSRANTGGTIPANNTEWVYDNAVVPHSFQGADSGYIKVMPPRGDNFLAFVPVPQTGARIEYVDHWTRGNWGVSNTHRQDFGIWINDSGPGTAGDANNYNLLGMTVAYIHSANIRNLTGSSYFHDTANGATYFTDTNRFPANYNPLPGGGHPSGDDYTPLFSTLVLGPGESQTYAFEFHAIRGGDGTPDDVRGGRNNRMDTQDLSLNQMMEREVNFRSTLYDTGIIDAVALPGFQPAIDMPTLIALRHDRSQVDIREVVIYCIHENDVFSDQHIPAWGTQAGRNRSRVTNTRGGRGVCDHPANLVHGRTGTEVIYREDLSGYQRIREGRYEWVAIYELVFTCIGNNSVRVYYDLIDTSGAEPQVIRPAFTQFEFNVLTELDELTMAHAVFLREQQQFSRDNPFDYTGDPSRHILYGIFFDWHLSAGPSRITGISTGDIFTVPPGAPAASRWGDDWSHGHALFMSMANYMNPTYENIRSLENFLLDFMWDRYMSNRHNSLNVPNFMGDSILQGNQSTTNDRFFSGAMVANTFFNMYRTMRAFPNYMEYREDALFYLAVAAGIWDNGLRGGWGSGAGVAFYGEQQVMDIIQALHREGLYDRRDTLVSMIVETRVFHDFGTYWPFRSEFEYDNTTEEGLYARIITLLNHNPDDPRRFVGETDRVLRHMQVFNWATRAKRGFAPNWFSHGVPQFRGGESWWNFQYTTSLAGFIMDDWLRYRYDFHNWGIEDISWANRVNYAAKMGNFNHVNMGQIHENHIGGTSATYSMRKGTFGAQSVQVASSPVMHNGWLDMGFEAALSIYGSLLSISTDVLNDTVFGPVAYGGVVTNFSPTNWTVRPRDGFGRRVNFLEERIYIESINNRILEASLTRNGSRLQLQMENLSGRDHVAQIYIYGLNPGFYSVLLDGTRAGQVYVPAVPHHARWGARALQAYVYVDVPHGDNFTVGFTQMMGGQTAAPEINIVSQRAKPWAGEALSLLGQILHDGSTTIDSLRWTVVSAPEGEDEEEVYSFESTTPIFTNTAPTLSRRASTWTTIDTSVMRGASFTPALPGEYVLRLEVTTSAGTTVVEYITLNVIANPNIGPPTVMEVDYEQHSNMVTISADVHNFDLDRQRAIEYTWTIIAWPANGEAASIIIPENPTEVLPLGWTGGHFERTTAILALPRGGNFIIQLTATDMGMTTTYIFEVSAHGEFDIRAYNVVTSAGEVPVLPTTIRLPVGGQMQDVDINWGTLNPANFTVPGSQVDVIGTATLADDSVISIVSTVFVVRDVTVRNNYAPEGTPFATWNNPGDLGGMTVVTRTNTPTGSANYSPAGTMGAWHNWGSEGSSERLEITWAQPRLIDRTDVFVMQNAAGSFRPFFDDFQVLTSAPASRAGITFSGNRPNQRPWEGAESANWITPRNLQGMGTANTLHQFNPITFEPMYVYGVALYLRPGAGATGLGVGILRWWPFGYDAEGGQVTPIDVDTTRLQILRDAAYEMSGGNRETGGTPGTTARFANWGTYGAQLNAARIAAQGVLANPESQGQVDAAAATLIEAMMRLVPVAGQAGNIAFHARREGSPPSPGQGHRINAINNNVNTGNWGTWGVGPLPSLNGTLAVPGGNFGVHWLQYDWPMGARIDASNIEHWRDSFTGTGGVNTPSVLRFWYLPLGSDQWVMAQEWSRAQLVEQITNAGNFQWSEMTFSEPLYARAVRVEFGRLITGTSQGVGVRRWEIQGTLLNQQAAPGPFTVTHNTTLEGTEGAIGGVTDAMEWRFGTTGPWTPVADGVTQLTGLANGNFYIRYAGFAGTAPSPATRVEVRLIRTDAPTGLGSEPATAGLSDGVITGVEPTMEFTNNYPLGPWYRVVGITIPGVASGTWYVRYSATDLSSASPATTVVVGVWDGEILPLDPPTNLIPSAPSRPGASDGSILGVTSAMEWRPVTEPPGEWVRVVGTRITGLLAGEYEVRFAATPRNGASAPVLVVVPDGDKGGQLAPIGLVAHHVTVHGGNDGRVTGVNQTMEWARAADAETWTAVIGNEIPDLEAGAIYVRRAGTPLLHPSPWVRLVIEEPAGPPTVVLNPTTALINDTNLSQVVLVEGTATGDLTVTYTIPATLANYITVTWVPQTAQVTVTGVRPTTGDTPVTGSFDVIVSREGATATLPVTVNLTPIIERVPVFSFDIFNNGPGGSPSRPNPAFEASGTIRMWTQLDGVNRAVPFADLTITAQLPDESCAMRFVTINRPWVDQSTVNFIDVTKNGPWQRIYLTATLGEQTVEVILINSRFFSLDLFNNGCVDLGATPSRPNPGLEASGIIRIWTQLNGTNRPVPFAGLTVTAQLPDESCAMEFVTINRPWVDQSTVNFIDVNKNRPWERIYLTATVFGQTVEVVLVNSLYEPTVVSFDIFNNGPGGSPSRPNPGLGPVIRMWGQINGVNTPLYLAASETIVATDQDGRCVVGAGLVRVNRRWQTGGWLDDFTFIDVTKNPSWQYINFYITVYGQEIHLHLVNGLH